MAESKAPAAANDASKGGQQQAQAIQQVKPVSTLLRERVEMRASASPPTDSSWSTPRILEISSATAWWSRSRLSVRRSKEAADRLFSKLDGPR